MCHKSRFVLAAILVGFLFLFLRGLVAGGDSQAAEGPKGSPSLEEIEILCGTSFRPPMERLLELYREQTGGRAVLVFGGSEDHLPKVKLKAIGILKSSKDPDLAGKFVEFITSEQAKEVFKKHHYTTTPPK